MKNPLSFLKRSRHPKGFVAIDLGSSFIKVAYFSFLPNKSLLLEDVKCISAPDGSIKYGVIENLDALITALEALELRDKSVIFGLSGESVFGFATTVRVKRGATDERVSKSELDTVLKKVHELAFMEASKVQAYSSDEDVDLVNSGVISTKIDNTFVDNILEFAGQNLEIGVFTSFARKSILSDLLLACKRLRADFVVATSQLYALSRIIRLQAGADSNCIIMDFGSDKTDVALCFGGGVVSTKTLDVGGKHITKAVSDALKIPFAEAESKKISFEDGTVDGERVKEVVDKALNFWLMGVETVFEDFEGIKVFPSKIFLSGGGALTYDLLKVLQERPWFETFSFREKPSVEVLSVKDELPGIADPNKYLSDVRNMVPVALGLVGLAVLG